MNGRSVAYIPYKTPKVYRRRRSPPLGGGRGSRAARQRVAGCVPYDDGSTRLRAARAGIRSARLTVGRGARVSARRRHSHPVGAYRASGRRERIMPASARPPIDYAVRGRLCEIAVVASARPPTGGAVPRGAIGPPLRSVRRRSASLHAHAKCFDLERSEMERRVVRGVLHRVRIALQHVGFVHGLQRVYR